MSKRNEVFIFCSGGFVTGVKSTLPLKVNIIDYDNAAVDEEAAKEVIKLEALSKDLLEVF